MLKKFIILCLLFILLGGGYILFMQPAMLSSIQNDIGKFIPAVKDIKGVNTSKQGNLPDQLKSEVDKNLTQAQEQARQIKIGDLMTIVGNAQKYIQDFRNFQEYLKKEAETITKNP